MPLLPSTRAWRKQLYEVVYESGTVAGKAFDVVLLIAIVASIVVVMLDSVAVYHDRQGHLFLLLEWTFTGLFTLEYIPSADLHPEAATVRLQPAWVD